MRTLFREICPVRPEPVEGRKIFSHLDNSRGVSIIAAVALILILGVFGLLVMTLTVTETETSLDQLKSLQAMEVAQGGAEYATRQLKADPTGYTGSSNVPLGNGTFSITVTDLGDGRKRLTATGTVGSAVRVVRSTVASPILDGSSTPAGTAETTIGTLQTHLPAGTNLIIAVVEFRNVSGNTRDINAGNLKLKKGAAILASNQNLIRVGRSTTPGSNNFPQETQFLLYRDAGAAANPTYVVTAEAQGSGISAEAKILVIQTAAASSFQDGGSVNVDSAADTPILSHATTLPAGDNVIMAAVQLDNTNGSNSRNISAGPPGNLRIRKGGVGGTTLSSNQFRIDLARSGRANRGTGMLLLARDAGSGANPTYTVTGRASGGATDVRGEVKILVLNGLSSAFLDTGSVAVGTSETVIGNLATSFAAGENVVIAANQFENGGGGQRNILAGNERLMVGGTMQASNPYDWNLCSSGTSNDCNDFTTGLLWYQPDGSMNPTYSTRALASGSGINGEAKILAIHLANAGVPTAFSASEWQEVY